MIFRFSVFNHCLDGRRCIEDLTRILSAQLRELGHEAEAVDEDDFLYERGTINVLYEAFADCGTIPRIERACGRGAKFLFVATEEPTPDGCFNGRLDNMMGERQAAFEEVAPLAEAILHLAPGEHVTRWCSRFAPSAYAEVGYARALLRRCGDDEPAAAFGFYGQMTPRRRAVFDRLEEMSGQTVVALPFIEHGADARDRLMRQVKVIPQVRAHDSQGIISSSRCATALHLGRPVVAEPHEHPGAWSGVVRFSETADDFYLDCVAALSYWRSLCVIQRALFASTLPAEACLGAPLRAVGIA